MNEIFAISDIHGCLDEFEEALSLVDLSGNNRLVLLGDYIHGGPDPYGVLDKVMELERKYGTEKVIALAGNHEDMVVDGNLPIHAERFTSYYAYDDSNDDKYYRWLRNLKRHYETEHQIFCHAGIDEEAGDLWKLGTDDFTFTEKYPAETGKFSEDMEIIAGHVGTAEISGNPKFHGIYFDGESHYYIDGTVLDSGVLPVLKVNVAERKYYSVTASGDWPILPYDEEYA